MPLKQCSVSGKSGWKWGDSGHCYTGKDGKKKAIKQGVAIEGPKKFKEMASTDKNISSDELLQAQISAIFDKSDDMVEDPSEEIPMCPDCNEPMQENPDNKDMMMCAKCGKEMKK